MASLGRVLQKVFGTSGGTTEFGQIGSDAAGSPTTTKDLDTIQSLSQYLLGLYAITNNANEPPRIEDFNSLFFLTTTQLKYLYQSGIPEWIATENYYADKSVVIYAGSIYGAITGSDGTPNINLQPDTETSDWQLLVNVDGAFNKSVVAEISGLTEKSTELVAADVFLGENSASSFSKIKVLFSNIFKSIFWRTPYSISSDHTITDTEIYNKYHFAHSASTGLLQGNLPTLSANIGKRYSFQNTGLGLSYINSEEGGNILFKGYSLDKLLMLKQGDKATLLATATGWLVEDYYMCIESGWYNRNDWAGIRFGFANFDYDTKSGGTGNMTGQKYTLASGVTGVILSDSQPAAAAGTLTVCFVTGTGLALNNEVGTCGSGQTFAVDEGSGSNKNQDWNITHNMGVNISLIEMKLFLNLTTGSYANAYLQYPTYSNVVEYGFSFYQEDSNNLKINVGAGGLYKLIQTSFSSLDIESDDIYGNVIIEIAA